jgi:ABC-type multidrug transport system ATPase subunit
MIQVKNLTVKFDGKVLYKNFSMEVNQGEKVSLAGESGTGKTTFINILLGFLPFQEGEIYVFDKKLNADNIHLIRSNIAYVPQELRVSLNSVSEMLYTPFQFKRNKDLYPSKQKLLSVLNALNLKDEILDKDLDEISGGQKQRLAIASALMLEKPLLIMDEPTSALDSNTIEKVAAQVLKNNQNTVLSTSHNPIWTNLSDKIYNLDNHGTNA